MTDGYELTKAIADIKHHADVLDEMLWKVTGHLVGWSQREFRKDTPKVIAKAKRRAARATLPELMSILLAYSDELHGRVDEQTTAGG